MSARHTHFGRVLAKTDLRILSESEGDEKLVWSDIVILSLNVTGVLVICKIVNLLAIFTWN